MTEYYGHKTMHDGRHIPLTKEEAETMRDAIADIRTKRADKLPTARDALRAISEAQDRLRELGWWAGGFKIKAGDRCAVAQSGSTGMWSGRMDTERKYVLFGDCVTSPGNAWLKAEADLTDDERAYIAECDKSSAEFQKRMLR